jgi:hypothetical protein
VVHCEFIYYGSEIITVFVHTNPSNSWTAEAQLLMWRIRQLLAGYEEDLISGAAGGGGRRKVEACPDGRLQGTAN